MDDETVNRICDIVTEIVMDRILVELSDMEDKLQEKIVSILNAKYSDIANEIIDSTNYLEKRIDKIETELAYAEDDRK